MPLKHRHFLAAPLFALSLLVTVAGVSTTSRAQMTSETENVARGEITAVHADKTFTLPRGVQGRVREDGVLHDDGDVLTLRQGTLLVASEAMTELQIGDVFFSAFHGGFLVTRNGTKFSVHALTSPVLIARGSFRLIIPAGMQGSWTAPEDLPSEVDLAGIVAGRQRLQMIAESILRDELNALAALPPSPSLQPGDASSAPELSTIVLSILLAETAERPSASQELLEYLRDDDLWLILSFHHNYQAAAWETSGSLGISTDARVLRWLQLPSSDVGGDAVTALAMDRWMEQTGKYVNTLTEPQSFLEPLLQSLRGYRAFAEQRGFPERLQRIAHALRTVIEPFKDHLSNDAKVLYAGWQELDAIVPYAEPAPLPPPVIEAAEPVTPVASEITTEPFDAAAVEARAKQMLLDAGALFTTQTSVRAGTPTRVLISNLLYVSVDGEHEYDFIFDPMQKQIQSLRRDGEPLPYPLSLDAFGAWAGGAPRGAEGALRGGR